MGFVAAPEPNDKASPVTDGASFLIGFCKPVCTVHELVVFEPIRTEFTVVDRVPLPRYNSNELSILDDKVKPTANASRDTSSGHA